MEIFWCFQQNSITGNYQLKVSLHLHEIDLRTWKQEYQAIYLMKVQTKIQFLLNFLGHKGLLEKTGQFFSVAIHFHPDHL